MHAPSTRKTLLALTLAAAFGGFAAIAIRAGLEQPANAETAAPAVLPAVSALPTTVAGQPLPSLAPMLEKVTPAVDSVRTRQVVRVSPLGHEPFFRRLFPELTKQPPHHAAREEAVEGKGGEDHSKPRE